MGSKRIAQELCEAHLCQLEEEIQEEGVAEKVLVLCQGSLSHTVQSSKG
jgi:hypothetical protein